MSTTSHLKIEKLLENIDHSIRKLGEIEEGYQREKTEITTELHKATHELAVLSDTQAVRATVIRELYWLKRVSLNFITESFGLTPGQVRKIAGSYTFEFPCPNECGRTFNKTFASLHEMDNTLRSQRSSKGFRKLCEQCDAEATSAFEAGREALAKRLRDRNEQLMALPWHEYIETKEWAYMRNQLLHWGEYRCRVCGEGRRSLYIHLTPEVPQIYNNHPYSDDYYILCRDCISRCADLIDENRFERVSEAFVSSIAAEYSSGNLQALSI